MIAIVITRVMGCYPNHRDLCLLWICGTDGAPGLGIAASARRRQVQTYTHILTYGIKRFQK
jgi:hypothetical protein